MGTAQRARSLSGAVSKTRRRRDGRGWEKPLYSGLPPSCAGEATGSPNQSPTSLLSPDLSLCAWVAKERRTNGPTRMLPPTHRQLSSERSYRGGEPNQFSRRFSFFERFRALG